MNLLILCFRMTENYPPLNNEQIILKIGTKYPEIEYK